MHKLKISFMNGLHLMILACNNVWKNLLLIFFMVFICRVLTSTIIIVEDNIEEVLIIFLEEIWAAK